MDVSFDILRNVLASLASTATIAFMFVRYLNKVQISHSQQISSIIKDTANAVFNNSQLEYRIKVLEKNEQEMSNKLDESFEKLNARLDQIYSIIAHIK